MESAAFTAMKIRAMIKLIEEDGGYLDRTGGSHRQYRHDQKKGVVAITGKPSDDLAAGTQKNILKRAGLKRAATLLSFKKMRPAISPIFPISPAASPPARRETASDAKCTTPF